MLSSLTPFFMWRLTLILLTPAAAALTAVFTALWPLHITSAGYFLSETPSLTFLVASLAVGYEANRSNGRAAVALGALAGLLGAAALPCGPSSSSTCSCRPSLGLGVAPAVSAVAGVRGCRCSRRSRCHRPQLRRGGKLTGISENSGLTFFLGHCDARVRADGHRTRPILEFGAPVAAQRGTGRRYVFPDHIVWEQGFFFRQAANCIREDGVGHFRILGRSLLEMTATTVIWPQSNEPRLKEVVNYTNVVYSVLLPGLIIGSLLLIRIRRNAGVGRRAGVARPSGLCVR